MAGTSAFATLALHADDDCPPAAGEVAPALTVTTTYTPEGEGAGYVYARMRESHSVRVRAERVIGALEGGHALLYSSGQAATYAALVHYAPRRIALRGGYHGTGQAAELLGRLARSFGGRCGIIDIDEAPAKGDVLWLETPNNPTCAVYDVAAYCEKWHAAGAHVVVDSTFAPPPLQRLLGLGADMVMHSATKYLAGHSDALGGVLVTRSVEVRDSLAQERLVLGSVPGNLEAWLLLRSLRTLEVRVRQQCAAAEVLARWLSGPAAAELGVHKVWHPSLPTHPNHAVARRQMPGGFGGVLSFEVSGDGVAERLPRHLRLFRNATSLGGVESLVEWRHKWDPAVSRELLRLSCGLESPEELRADVERALRAARAEQVRARL